MSATIDQSFLALTETEMHALPHGIVRLDKNGAILYHGGVTVANARRMPNWLGLRVFSDVSPCEPVKELQGHYERFVAKPGSGIEAYPFTLRFAFGARRVTFTMVRRAASDGGLFVVINSRPVDPAGGDDLCDAASARSA